MNNNPTKFYSGTEGDRQYALIISNGNDTIAGMPVKTFPTTVAYCSHRSNRGCRTSGHHSTTLKASRFWIYQQSELSGGCSGWTEYESGNHETITSREAGWSNHRW